MAESGWSLLLSCEHGGNLVPEPWQGLFAGQAAVLASHRGYDLGVADFARWLAAELQAPLQIAEVTRLLVELNRSPGHPALFSEFSRVLGPAERRSVLACYYAPYRRSVERQITQQLASAGRVCHVSLHSFTSELNGARRNADIGLLYDPRRPLEQAFCRDWQRILGAARDGWRVRRNYPYRGAADSLVTWLRRRFPGDRYLGIELELNQCWPLQGGVRWAELQKLICASLGATLGCWNRRNV